MAFSWHRGKRQGPTTDSGSSPHDTVARNYSVGAAGRLNLHKLPLTGAYTTYALQKDNPTLPDYVTDSAASGTGWATGRKTYDGAISVLPNGKPVPTILEQAKAAGYRTGDATNDTNP